jgi:VanZ family protein
MIPVRSRITPIERTHLFEYGLLAVLLYEALKERKRNGGAVRLSGVSAILATAFFGWLDEAVQAYVPNRVYDHRDVGINALAAIVAVGALTALRWGRERAHRGPVRSETGARPGSADATR